MAENRESQPQAPPPREGSHGPRGRDRGDRGRPGGRGPGRGGGGGRRFYRRRKVCKFCVERVDHIDYKDVKLIGQFVSDRGKILPRRLTGVCSPHQRQLKVAVKRARNIALLPFAVEV
ncbi:MAG: 30S ribosomal protein S18 [Candidatus Acidoferrales bacterium]